MVQTQYVATSGKYILPKLRGKLNCVETDLLYNIMELTVFSSKLKTSTGTSILLT